MMRINPSIAFDECSQSDARIVTPFVKQSKRGQVRGYARVRLALDIRRPA